MTDGKPDDGSASDTAKQLGALLDEYECFTDQSIDRNEYATLKRAVETDVVPITEADRSFFVLGNYDDEDRLRLVANRLKSVGEPFLLKDLETFDDSVLGWTTQFKIMAKRATHIVALYENSEGGHEWEAGWLDHRPYREKLTVFKRDYPNLDREEKPFDGMFAHFVETLKACGQVYQFEAPEDAPPQEVERGVETCINDYKMALLDE
ncbi:hypothetical protein [Halorussus litoreus]|uniref:hypothetical protein n=1 Tax=Halorussus litoreus TaxID=1710536 RepID=UPI000E288D79|nr:hypothetical protein [Halorussus litoreus]